MEESTHGGPGRCPHCAAPVVGAVEFCPECFGQLDGDPGRPVDAHTPGSSPPDREGVAGSLDQAAASTCPRHPDKPVHGTCRRCGAFLCVTCNPKLALRDHVLCPDCQARAAEAEAGEVRSTSYRDIGVSTLLLGLLIGVGVMVGGSIVADEPIAISLFFAVVVSSPFHLAGGLCWWLKVPWMAWAAVSLQGIVALLEVGTLLMGKGGWLVALVTSAIFVSSALKVTRLGKAPPPPASP